MQRAQARQARFQAGGPGLASLLIAENSTLPNTKSTLKIKAAKKDFFGRVVVSEGGMDAGGKATGKVEENRVWVSFHEGFSNAVRKPISLEELVRGM